MSTEPPSRIRLKRAASLQAGSAPPPLFFGGAALSLPAGFLAAFLTSSASEPPLSGPLFALSICAVLAIIVLNGFYVLGQKSIDVLKPHHLRMFDPPTDGPALSAGLQKANDGRQARLRRLLEDQLVLVDALSIGSFTMWCWLMLALVIPARPLAVWLEASFGWPGGFTGFGWTLVALSIPAAALNAIAGQLIPTSLAAQHPVEACIRFGGLARFLALPFIPAARLSVLMGNLITRRFGASAGFDLTNSATQQIISVLEEIEESEEEATPELEMLDSVIEFTRSVAREIMTPRVDMITISHEATIADAAEMVNLHRKSRMPIFKGTDDSILGAVHAKDVLLAVTQGLGAEPVTAIMREVLFVPETKGLQELLTEMRDRRAGLAIIQDEYGGTEGLVTTEDIVEEILGEIVDEHDREEPILVPAEGGWIAGGRMNLEDLGREIGFDLYSREFDTVGGYVFGLFGRQPTPGDSLVEEGLRFTIRETDGRRITSVHIEPIQPQAAASAG